MNTTMPQSTDNLRIRLSKVGDPVIDIPAPAQVEGGIVASDLKIQYNVLVRINRPESRVDVVVSMVYLSGQNKLFSGSLTTGFDVVDLTSYITAKEGEDEFRIESDFLPMLINIAFSTTRGYFARELVGSALAPYPFPMISMDILQKHTTYQLI